MSAQITPSANADSASGSTTLPTSNSATIAPQTGTQNPPLPAPSQVFMLPDFSPVNVDTAKILSLPTAIGSIYTSIETRLRSLPPQCNINLRRGVVLQANLEIHQRLALLVQTVGHEELDYCSKCVAEEGVFESCVTVWTPHEQSWLSVSCLNCYFERPDLSCSL